MKLKLPIEIFQINTSFSPEIILSIIQTNTAPRKLFRMTHDHPYFEGEISAERFQINRIIHYRNSFLPRITGTITPQENGTKIDIKMKLHPFITVFMAVWFTGVILATLAVLFVLLTKPEEATIGMLVPLVMLVFGIALVSGGFWFEAPKQKEKLISLFKN